MELRISKPTQFLEAITWNFEELKNELTKTIEPYKGLIVQPDQVKASKSDLANLRKQRKTLEDERKRIKAEIEKPYKEFESKEKELLAIIDDGIKNIDDQVKAFEQAEKEEKEKKIFEIWKKSVGDLDRVITWQKVFNPKWLNKTTSLKSIKDYLDELTKRVDQELKQINMENSPYILDMKEAYKMRFSISDAMAKKQQLEAEAEARAKFEEERNKEKRVSRFDLSEYMPVPEAEEEVIHRQEDEVPEPTIKSVTLRFTYDQKDSDKLNKIIAQLGAIAKIEKVG